MAEKSSPFTGSETFGGPGRVYVDPVPEETGTDPEAKSEEAKSEEAKSEEAKSEEAKSEEAKSAETIQDLAKQILTVAGETTEQQKTAEETPAKTAEDGAATTTEGTN